MSDSGRKKNDALAGALVAVLVAALAQIGVGLVQLFRHRGAGLEQPVTMGTFLATQLIWLLLVLYLLAKVLWLGTPMVFS